MTFEDLFRNHVIKMSKKIKCPLSLLNSACQKTFKSNLNLKFQEKVTKEKLYTASVVFNGKVRAEAEGYSKKKARTNAAKVYVLTILEGYVEAEKAPAALEFANNTSNQVKNQVSKTEKCPNMVVTSDGTESMEDNTNKLIINNLPQTMTDYQLRLLFIPMGEIVSAKILRDKNCKNYGSGQIIYQNPEDAAKAVVKLNGLEVSNKRIEVSTEESDDTNLFIGNVPQDCSEEDLDKLFGAHGMIITRKLLRAQGNIGGIAFIRFSKKLEAASAMQKLKGYKFPGAVKGLKVKVAGAGAEDYYSGGYLRSPGDVTGVGQEQNKDTNLYIRNIPKDCSEEFLYTLFGKHGMILTKKLMRGRGKRGIAFLRFSEKEEADSAREKLNGYLFPGAVEGFEVKVAEPKAMEFYTGDLRGEDGVKDRKRKEKEKKEGGVKEGAEDRKRKEKEKKEVGVKEGVKDRKRKENKGEERSGISFAKKVRKAAKKVEKKEHRVQPYKGSLQFWQEMVPLWESFKPQGVQLGGFMGNQPQGARVRACGGGLEGGGNVVERGRSRNLISQVRNSTGQACASCKVPSHPFAGC